MTPFYKKALQLFAKTQTAQIKKGLEKYPEPFNPFSWTPEELLNHALEETVDLTHYLVGLKDLLDEKDAIIEKQKHAISENCDLRLEIERLKEELEVERGFKVMYAKEVNRLFPKKSPFEQQYDLNYNPVPKYFDPDDQ